VTGNAAIDFGSRTLPYGVIVPPGQTPRVAVGYQTLAVDLVHHLGREDLFAQPSLNALLAAGEETWAEIRRLVEALVANGIEPGQPGVHRQVEVETLLPVTVADFVDFFSGIEHATNAGRIFRPEEEPLKPNYRYLPVGYHGRAGSVVGSGTPITRPVGQIRREVDVDVAPSARLDIEVEVGYVVGTPSVLGIPVPASAFREHVFGCVLLIDWSARDIQAWEYQPLGPFLGKSFATTISSWVVPMAALDGAWVDGPAQEPTPVDYLQVPEPRNHDLRLTFLLNGHPVSHPKARGLYWSAAQQLAHMTRNGAPLRTGDIYGTGTISSFASEEQGSLLELSHGGTREMALPDGTLRTYLEDGDEVTITGCIRNDAWPLGTATGKIVGSVSQEEVC
jgi:fumarylacetoacetase